MTSVVSPDRNPNQHHPLPYIPYNMGYNEYYLMLRGVSVSPKSLADGTWWVEMVVLYQGFPTLK
jgi:hypothetical protein